MRLVISTLLAALLAVPLAADAARATARYSVTLRATIVDRVTYERTLIDDDCTTRRSGSGGRAVRLESLRPVQIEVALNRGAARYRPVRVGNVRAVTTQRSGSYQQTKLCRAMPLETTRGTCRASDPTARIVRPVLRRPGRNRLSFRSLPRAPVRACGVGLQLLGGWIDIAAGSVDEQALVAGRSRRIVASGSDTYGATQSGVITMKADALTTVRWTLTFRRLG